MGIVPGLQRAFFELLILSNESIQNVSISNVFISMYEQNEDLIRCCRCGKVESPLLCTRKRSLEKFAASPESRGRQKNLGRPSDVSTMAAPLRSALAVSIAEDMNPSCRRAVSCFSSCFVGSFPISSWIVLCSYVLAHTVCACFCERMCQCIPFLDRTCRSPCLDMRRTCVYLSVCLSF